MTDKIREQLKEILSPAINCDSPYAKFMIDTIMQLFANSHAAPDAVVKALEDCVTVMFGAEECLSRIGSYSSIYQVRAEQLRIEMLKAKQALASLPVQHNHDVLPKTTGDVAWNNPPLPVQPDALVEEKPPAYTREELVEILRKNVDIFQGQEVIDILISAGVLRVKP